jgi:hypothetical protein
LLVRHGARYAVESSSSSPAGQLMGDPRRRTPQVPTPQVPCIRTLGATVWESLLLDRGRGAPRGMLSAQGLAVLALVRGRRLKVGVTGLPGRAAPLHGHPNDCITLSRRSGQQGRGGPVNKPEGQAGLLCAAGGGSPLAESPLAGDLGVRWWSRAREADQVPGATGGGFDASSPRGLQLLRPGDAGRAVRHTGHPRPLRQQRGCVPAWRRAAVNAAS